MSGGAKGLPEEGEGCQKLSALATFWWEPKVGSVFDLQDLKT